MDNRPKQRCPALDDPALDTPSPGDRFDLLVKFLFSPSDSPRDLERLRELDFDTELRRTKA
ncbi:MAG TPA: hypothetical protein P5186_22465 [Candidatus Paceibacterota bacterium]|nr:hypothetical protein [Candidatus Paceibacterota bacterium]